MGGTIRGGVLDVAAGGPLLGRDREVAALDDALTTLAAGGCAALCVRGEPGIGKTRLLMELCGRAEDARMLVLAGGATELACDEPFGVVVDALDDYLASLDARTVQRRGETWASELRGVFPSFPVPVSAETSLQSERFRAHQATRTLLERLATRRPLVLALDDLHWADGASVELISHLLRRPPRGPVLLALGMRSAPAALSAALAAAERGGGVVMLEPAALAPEQADELVGDLSRELRAELYQQSGGNPFYLEQLARARGADGAVPPTVTAALNTELERLSDEARQLIQGAAVADEPFDPELAAAAAGLDHAAATHLMDELLASNVVRATDVPRRFRFRHPIVRHAVYDSAPSGWRLAAHGRAAAELAVRGAPATSRAQHVELSAVPGDQDAITLLGMAAEQAAPRAPASAARWYEAALRLMPDDPDNRLRRLVLLVALARALGASGDITRSSAVLHELLDVLPPEMAGERADVIAFIGTIEALLGRPGNAGALLEAALDEVPERTSPAAVAIELALAADRFLSGDFDGMRSWSASAVTTARACSSPSHVASSVATLALAEYHLGRVRQAREGVGEARAMVDVMPDAALGQRIESLYSTAWCEWGLDDYAHAHRHFERCLEVSRNWGQSHMLVPILVGRAMTAFITGRLALARELADTALDAAYLGRNPQLESWTRLTVAWVAVRAGDVADAETEAREAVTLAESLADSLFTVLARCVFAEARIEAGNDAAADLAAAAGGAELPAIEVPMRPYWYDVLARAEAAAGRPQEAAEWADRAARVVKHLDIGSARGYALRARAAALRAAGEDAAAATAALEAAAQFAAAGIPVEEARARTLAGLALAAGDNRDRALAELDVAHRTLGACGAARHRDEAAGGLRRLGRWAARETRPGTADSGVAALSGRELEIAELVAKGRTNRQIAAELYLSEKTIERYLGRVFAKLDVSSRTLVAGVLAKQGAGDAAQK